VNSPLKRYKEVRQNIPLIYCKIRLSAPRSRFVAADANWGFLQAIRKSMVDIDRQIHKAEHH